VAESTCDSWQKAAYTQARLFQMPKALAEHGKLFR
jgi:hypothetical protein